MFLTYLSFMFLQKHDGLITEKKDFSYFTNIILQNLSYTLVYFYCSALKCLILKIDVWVANFSFMKVMK